LLNGVATALTQFTQTQFDQLEFQAGANGEVNDIIAAAFTVGGASPALQVTNTVSGTRSINSAKALDSTGTSYDFIPQRAALVQGLLPNQDPTLAALGNFTSQAGDHYRVADLFALTQPKSGTITDIDVAVRGSGGGALYLNGAVTAQTVFTQAEFDTLEF